MTEEQKEIVLLGSRIEILNKYIDFSKDGIIEREEAIKAMQEYAELYHVAQLRKLRQDAVSGRSEQLVCSICNGKGKYIDTHPERYGEVKCKCGAK